MSKKKSLQSVALPPEVATQAPDVYAYVFDDHLAWSEDGEDVLMPSVHLMRVVREIDGQVQLINPMTPDHVIERCKDEVSFTREGAINALRSDMQRKKDLLDGALAGGPGAIVHCFGPTGTLDEEVGL